MDEVDTLLGGETVPDTVTGQYNELVVVQVDIMLDGIGERGHHLLAGAEVLVVLVGVVSDGAGERQVAVDTVHIDPAASSNDSAGLCNHPGFVVERESLCTAVKGEHCAAVPCVGTNQQTLVL